LLRYFHRNSPYVLYCDIFVIVKDDDIIV